jgi:hypothetical protein
LLQEQVQLEMTGDSYERRMHQEQLELAARQLGEYVHEINEQQAALAARRAQLTMAAGAPYVTSEAVSNNPGQFIMPELANEGVQVSLPAARLVNQVTHQTEGPMKIKVDDAHGEGGHDYDEGLKNISEEQALKGAAGRLSKAEMKAGQTTLAHIEGTASPKIGPQVIAGHSQLELEKGKRMLAHIHDTLDMHDYSAKVGKKGSLRKGAAKHMRQVLADPRTARTQNRGMIHIAKAQALVDHLPKSVLKKLQAAENDAGVAAEGAGAGGEITGWGEDVAKSVTANTTPKQLAVQMRPASARRSSISSKSSLAAKPVKHGVTLTGAHTGAAHTALHTTGPSARARAPKFEPMFNLDLDGFGMKMAASVKTMKLTGEEEEPPAVQTWQPGAAAWYAYMSEDEVDPTLRRRSGLDSSARSMSAGGCLGFAVASALFALAYSQQRV